MGFEMIKKVERQRVWYPALHLVKNGQAFTNPAFLEAADIPHEDPDKPKEPYMAKFDLYFDADENKLALKFHKDGQMVKPVNMKRRQIHFYLKTTFKSLNRVMPTGIFKLEKVKHPELGTMWVADIGVAREETPTEGNTTLKKMKKKLKERKHNTHSHLRD